MSPGRWDEITAFLKQPDLLTRTNELIGKSEVVGEEVNRLLIEGLNRMRVP